MYPVENVLTVTKIKTYQSICQDMNKSVIVTAFHKFRNIEIFEATNNEKMNDKDNNANYWGWVQGDYRIQAILFFGQFSCWKKCQRYCQSGNHLSSNVNTKANLTWKLVLNNYLLQRCNFHQKKIDRMYVHNVKQNVFWFLKNENRYFKLC